VGGGAEKEREIKQHLALSLELCQRQQSNYSFWGKKWKKTKIPATVFADTFPHFLGYSGDHVLQEFFKVIPKIIASGQHFSFTEQLWGSNKLKGEPHCLSGIITLITSVMYQMNFV
jgi:hypothetical protein